MIVDPARIDLTPALTFFAVGAGLSAIPLIWWWRQRRSANFVTRQKSLAWMTLFLAFDLVLFGAFTRLTDSGLGCPDWPGCYAHASPIGASASINRAQDLMPSGPVTIQKAWIEMIHRYLATAVGTLIAALCAHAWWQSFQMRKLGRRSDVNPWLPTLCLVWVSVVGAFGALTVTLKLQPAIVSLHLLGALLLLCLLVIQVYQVSQAAMGWPKADFDHALQGRWRVVTALTFAVLWVQIGLGAWVSTNYAVLACHTFPSCNGSWWPAMDFEEGFTLWRKLGYTADGDLLAFDALVAIHYTHRLFACAALVLLGLLAWHIYKNGKAKLGTALGVLASLQLLTGLFNVVLNWPLLSALLHTGGAALLLVLVCWQLCMNHLTPTPYPGKKA